MRKFNITVNGTSYQVEVEEVGAQPAVAPVAPIAAVAQAQPAAPVAAAAPAKAKPAAPAGGKPLTAPMPGAIVKIVAASGTAVKRGDTVLLLEAMKMENPIAATADGVVTIIASVGDKVEPGDVIATIA